MPAIQSTLISYVAYDATSRTLLVTFKKSGDTWAYDPVPQEEYDSLVNAGSAGRYFLDNIRGSYNERRT
jgi:hypothetical protein